MSRPKSTMTLRKWLANTTALWMFVCVTFVWLVACALGLLVFVSIGTSPKEIDDTYQRQHTAVEVFTKGKGTAQARQELAESLLSVRRQGVPVEMLKDDKVVSQIKHIATSGDRIDLHPKPFNFLDYHHTFLIVVSSILYVVLACLFYALHVECCHDYQLAYRDLPWRAGWPWLLLTMSPLLLWPIGYELWKTRRATADDKSNTSTRG